MKRFRRLSACALEVCCLAAGTDSAPPPIDSAALQPYARGGTGSIDGSTRLSGTVSCAPDIPYVHWYLSQHSRRPTWYVPRLGWLTRMSLVDKQGRFSCKNLAPGRYLVWIVTEAGMAPSSVFLQAPEPVDSSGELGVIYGSSRLRQGGTPGSDQRAIVGPESVTVGTGSTVIQI